MPLITTFLLALVASLTAVNAQASHHHKHASFHNRAGSLDDALHYNASSLINKTILTEPFPASLSPEGSFRNAATLTYQLCDSYTSSNFFSTWSFFSGPDPTHGFVNYIDEGTAWNEGLIGTEGGQIRMGVDSRNRADDRGRKSVRLTSNKAYNRGLFIIDLAHMPGAACGSWPAFWMFGPNWPSSGEIDIIEGVNLQSTNSITLHTSPNCIMNFDGSAGAIPLDSNCNANNGYNGCSVSTRDSRNFGSRFNQNGGGLYAMQWEGSGIYVWFFPRNAVPKDIGDRRPMTQNWGAPVVAFNGGNGCNVNERFRDMNIVFDTTFCGDWAGGVFGQQCGYTGQSCVDYVRNNPEVFRESYWKVNSVNVYQLG